MERREDEFPELSHLESTREELEDLEQRLRTELAYDPPHELVRRALLLFDPQFRKLIA